MSGEVVRGIIGDGFVTEFMLTASAKNLGADHSKNFVLCQSEERQKKFREFYNIKAVLNADEFFPKIEVLFLTLQSDDMEKIFSDINKKIPPQTLIISAIHDLKIKTLEKIFPNHPIIRSTLSPQSLIGKGICAYVVGKNYSADSESVAQFFLSYFGKNIKVSSEKELDKLEDLILATTIFSARIINSLIECGVKDGLDEEKSKEVISNIVAGEIDFLMKKDSIVDYLIQQGSGEKEIFERGKEILERYGILSKINKSFDSEESKELFKFHYRYW